MQYEPADLHPEERSLEKNPRTWSAPLTTIKEFNVMFIKRKCSWQRYWNHSILTNMFIYADTLATIFIQFYMNSNFYFDKSTNITKKLNISVSIIFIHSYKQQQELKKSNNKMYFRIYRTRHLWQLQM